MSTLRVEFGHTVTFQTWDELVTARERMLTEGWQATPYDSPETGMRAFGCFKTGETNTLLRWFIYGKELEPVVTVCDTWEEFVREIQFRTEEEMDKSDDLENSYVGFVAYGRALTSGKAEIFRLHTRVLVDGGPPARAALIAILMRSKHPGASGLKAIAPASDER